MIAMRKLFLILFFFSISFSQFQKSFNQTSSINITGNASTIIQSEIDARLNVNKDGLTWDVTEADVTPSFSGPITFTTQQVESLSSTPLGQDKIVLAWCDEASKSINFKIYSTYGQVLVDTVTVDSSPGVTNACDYNSVSVAALNTTHFVIAWFDAAEQDATFAVYDYLGNLRLGPIDEDTNVGTNSWGVSVSAFNSTHIVIGYYDYVDQDATFSTWNLVTQTRVSGPIDVDTAVSTDSYNVFVATLNSTHFVFFYYDAGATDDATFAVYTITGTAVVAATDEDANIGNSYSLSLTVLNSSYFVVAYYDAADQDITFSIYNTAGTRVVGPIDEDINVGASGAFVSVAALNSTHFVIAYYDTVDGQHTFSIYRWNTRVVGPIDVSNVAAGLKWVSVTSYQAGINLGLCNQNWIFAEVNATNNARFFTYTPSGSYWNGYCFPVYQLSVEHNTTVSYQGVLQNISFFVNFSSTTNKNYNISIYDFLNNRWTSCQNITALANVWYSAWCNISSNVNNYVSSDKKIRVRINSTMDYNRATLKEEYVQFYLYSCYPIWSNQQQSTNKPAIGAKVNLSTFWQNCVALDKAWLSTNETGAWKNYTDIYLINFNGATSGWSNFTWQNSSLPTGTIVAWRIYANDTFGNENTTSIMTFEIRPTYLLVNLTFPEPEIYNDNSPLLVNQNTTFMVNSTVLCFSDGDGAVCQNVSGTIRYNATSLNPDTPISETYGATPFFINETPANSTKLCGTLNQNQICNLSWVINATGNVNSAWKIGVLFNSSYTNIPQNHTKNATLLISTCIIDISLKFNSIDFGNVLPNTVGNPAIGNNNNIYNITVNPGSCNVDLYINSTDLVNNTFNSKILAGNLSFNNVTNDYSTSFRFNYLWKLVRSNVPASTNVTLWFWLDVPPIYAGYYLGTLFVKAVSVGAKP